MFHLILIVSYLSFRLGSMLERIADCLGCRILIETPYVGDLGEYDAARHVIRLHPRLSGILLSSVLAHELGHAAYRHHESTPHNEWQADAFAHWVQIPFCQYVEATQLHGTAQGVAHELGVLPSTVRDYTRRVRQYERGP